ncbi:MAG: hypothetical protein K2Q12_08070, partial [Rickettsiales bacterium]|nr:hypothetical protein [Rickettsiales bacterium]
MSSYRYFFPSPLSEISFRKGDAGGLRAYLVADANTSTEKLSHITQYLLAKGYQAIPVGYDEKPALEVRGFSNKEDFMRDMKQNGFIQGSAVVKKLPEHQTLWQKFRKNTLPLSSAFFLIGDASFIRYGMKEKSMLDTSAGLFYAGGTLSNIIGSKDSSDLQIRDLASKVADFIAKQPEFTSATPSALETNTAPQHHSLTQRAYDFVRHYPSDMLNGFFAMAGACIAAAAFNKYKSASLSTSLKEAKHIRSVNIKDMGLGLTTLSAGAFGILVEEKKPDPNKPPAHGIEGIWQKIQANPLTITGIGYLVSTLFHAASSFQIMRHGNAEEKKAVLNRAVFVGANLIAELLVAVSSKGHGSGIGNDASVNESVIALAADKIASQPREGQEGLVDYVSGFLCSDAVLSMKKQ